MTCGRCQSAVTARQRWCPPCYRIVRNERQRVAYIRDRATVARRKRSYYVSKRDEILSKARTYYAAHADRIRARMRARYHASKGKPDAEA